MAATATRPDQIVSVGLGGGSSPRGGEGLYKESRRENRRGGFCRFAAICVATTREAGSLSRDESVQLLLLFVHSGARRAFAGRTDGSDVSAHSHQTEA